MSKLECPRNLIDSTIRYLQTAGHAEKECVVFWLTPSARSAPFRVAEVFRPEQEARADQFWIPPHAMTALMKYLRDNKLKLSAQVHSHPEEAFHSTADDRWAVIRHAGALSIVIPDFSSHTTPDNFCAEAKFFQLSPNDQWLGVPSYDVFGLLP